MLGELVLEQAPDSYCHSDKGWVLQPRSEFWIKTGNLLSRRSHINGAKLVLVTTALRERILSLPHCLPATSHPGRHCMCETLSQESIWLYLACAHCRVVEQWRIYICNQNHHHFKRPLVLLPPSRLVGFVAMDKIGPLQKNGNSELVAVVSDRCSKLAQAV